MRYLTCEACRFDPAECSRRQAVATMVQAFNVSVPPETRMTMLRFTCPDRLIGFELGARVVVEEAIVRDEYAGYGDVRQVVETAERHGTVVGHLTDHVQIWLDEETSRGKRWIRLKPMPRLPEGSIGVTATGKRGDLRAASLEMLRGIEKRDGSPPATYYWCPSCRSHSESFMAELRDDKCPACGFDGLVAEVPPEVTP